MAEFCVSVLCLQFSHGNDTLCVLVLDLRILPVTSQPPTQVHPMVTEPEAFVLRVPAPSGEFKINTLSAASCSHLFSDMCSSNVVAAAFSQPQSTSLHLPDVRCYLH